MLSPYALSRPGGVQGQTIGAVAAALRARATRSEVTVRARRRQEVPGTVREHVIGWPAELHSNGSVAPVALWPSAAARAERFVRKGGFDVAHLHEPLAPMAAYGLVLTAPLPMVGTYHRAGVKPGGWPPSGRWPSWWAAACRSGWPSPRRLSAPTGLRSGGGDFEVLFNGVEMERFESAPPRRDEEGRPAVLFLGRHEQRKGLNVLLDAFAMLERRAVLWVAGDGPAAPSRPAPAVPRLGSGALAGAAERRRGGRPTGGGRRALRAFPAGRVLRDGAPRRHGGRLRRGGLRHRGLPHGVGRSRRPGAPR